jgi:hypothetical protein
VQLVSAAARAIAVTHVRPEMVCRCDKVRFAGGSYISSYNTTG